MTDSPQSNYWLDVAVREILAAYPDGEIVISSGISPSASYHIGHFREIMTADALTWGVKQAGRQASHVHVVDNFDPLRKRYEFLPESFEQYVGWPICLVPDPFDGCRAEHRTYAEHFYQEFEGFARQMGIIPDVVTRSYEDLYSTGLMASNIELAIEGAERIKQIFMDLSKRELPEDWLPLQLLSPNKSFTELTYRSIDLASRIITATDAGGEEFQLNYAEGEVKLNWRLDWPGRWKALGVKVEPFSAQEHGASGGSYDTGVIFSREIFDYEPPIPGVRYANIHMIGDTKKMSSSKGNLVTPAQALQIMPPEVLRYFVVRSRPDRTLFWDSSMGLFNLIDEYSQVKAAAEQGEQHEFGDAYSYASATRIKDTISSVPFAHLVQVYQAAQQDPARIMQILERTGYAAAVEREREVILRELKFVEGWLRHYAPDSLKFAVQKTIPRLELSDNQKIFLADLALAIEADSLDGQGMHAAIYAAKEQANLKPAQAFQAIYQVVLNKDSGPKAGWFLASLDQKWLVQRLRLEV